MAEAKLHLVTRTDEVSPAFMPDYNYKDWIEDLRGLVWNFAMQGRMSFEDMAVMANLHVSTVTKFAWGDTKRPAFSTVFELARVIGFRLPFISIGAGRQPDERDHRSARQYIQSRPSK